MAARNGQHEDVAVPEDVAAVAGAAQAARADGRLAVVADRRHQVEEREADRALQLRVALDDDVGVCQRRAQASRARAAAARSPASSAAASAACAAAGSRVVGAEPLEHRSRRRSRTAARRRSGCRGCRVGTWRVRQPLRAQRDGPGPRERGEAKRR